MKNTLILLLLVAFGCRAQQETFKIADGVINHQDLFNTSMNPDVSCYRIPALATAPNGDIIAAIGSIRLRSVDDRRCHYQ